MSQTHLKAASNSIMEFVKQSAKHSPPTRLTFQGPFVELVQEIIWQLVLFVAHQLDTADG